MEKGMKPMPVILKIIWIILIVNSSLALLGISGVFVAGIDFMGMSLYGLYAINVFFLVKIALPIVLIIGMHQRYKWIWIYGVGLFLLYALNNAFTLHYIEEPYNKLLNQMSEQMSEMPDDIDEGIYEKIIRLALQIGLVISMLFNLTVGLFFTLKRKFYLPVTPVPPSEGDLSS